MQKATKHLWALLGLFLFFTSCLSTYEVPEEYLPDDEVVYLKQRVEFGPIYYEPEATDPYEWSYDVEVDSKRPTFTGRKDFRFYLAPNYKEDVRVFKEVKSHLLYVEGSSEYLALKEKLESFNFVPPEQRSFATGKLVKEYNNAMEYEYPAVAGATIIVFANSSYDIKLPEGNTYMARADYFAEYDKNERELYTFFLKSGAYRVMSDDYLYGKYDDRIMIEGAEGELVKISSPPAQYQFHPKGVDYHYTFFIGKAGSIEAHSVINEKANLRYDYFSADDYVLIVGGDEAVTINSSYEKFHKKMDKESGMAKDTVSIYFKEGLQVTAFDQALSYSNFTPAWPEGYLSKRVGGFTIYYTRGDGPLLSKLNGAKLSEIYRRAEQVTGMKFVANRTIILPPNLESYRKIAARTKGETMQWYPSGYQLKDMIIMWPPSVPRYDSPEGESYFWESEFYEILLHELVHLIVGENSGIFSSLPVWLNEGLALYVEAEYAADSKFYWEITFAASYGLKRLLPWDDVTVNSTSFYPVGEARIHYAQSYKMVTFLVERYGRDKVAAYVKSFKSEKPFESSGEAKRLYKDKFAESFGLSWEENLIAFKEYLEGK